MASKGYKYFTGGDYDVNIIGVRNSETKGRVAEIKFPSWKEEIIPRANLEVILS